MLLLSLSVLMADIVNQSQQSFPLSLGSILSILLITALQVAPSVRSELKPTLILPILSKVVS